MQDQSHKRHIAKIITWRVIDTLYTIVLSWIISGSPFIGLKTGVVEGINKMLLYYGHERFWFKSKVKIQVKDI